ncbi:TPA: hypothetical protein ACQD71_004012 [Yersinia enterocolitica]
MNIIELANELEKLKNIEKIINVSRGCDTPSGNKKILKQSVSIFKDGLKSNQHHKVVAIFIAMLLYNADDTISRLKRGGHLRSSRYNFRHKAIKRSIEVAIAILPRLDIRDERVNYLYSVQALISLSPQVRKIKERLVIQLIENKTYVLKTIFAVINQVFSNHWIPDDGKKSTDFEYWSAEKLAEATSYIINLMREEVGIKISMWQNVDPQCDKKLEKIYYQLLIDAATIKEYNEAEATIDGLPYKARFDGVSLTISAIDEDFEKAIRLGYIQSQIQKMIRIESASDNYKGGLTIDKFISDAFSVGLGEMIEISHHPLPRLILKIPFISEFFEPITTESLYLEEIPEVVGFGIDSFLKLDGLLDAKVIGTIKVIDVIKVQRLFSLINAVFKEKIKTFESNEINSALVLRSVIPIIEESDFNKLLSQIIPLRKKDEILSFLTMDDDEKFIDIQYKPFFKIGGSYIISPALISRSNLVRNIVVGSKLNEKSKIRIDPMQNCVIDALKRSGFEVYHEFTYDIFGKRETDILCWKEDMLFIFECKNSFHPCSTHELRTSYEHIKKAKEQLDIRLEWVKDTVNQSKLFKYLGMDVPVTNNIYTGIITANRMFSGYKIGVHPVRHAHELINVLLNGVIHINNGDSYNFWHGDEFSSIDLVEYLSGDMIVHDQYELLIPHARDIKINNNILRYESYIMDVTNINEDFIYLAKKNNHPLKKLTSN